MTDILYQLEERRQKMQKNTYLVLCLILILSAGFYIFNKWNQYQLAIQGVAQNRVFIAELRNDVSSEKTQTENKKLPANQLNKEIEQKLKMIFPATDDYTNLTRKIDEYELRLSTKSNPFEISNIDYQSPIQADTYSILPLRMNIRSSRENFTKFLHMVESSGNLKDNVRLMDMSSIRLNFENNDDGGGPSNIISFAVQINAYFQK